MSRRQVIKTFVLGTAFSNAVAESWAETFVGEVQETPAFTPGLLKVDLNDFPVLGQPLGSVRLGTFPIQSNHQTDAWLKPIIINRDEGDRYHVVSAVCTHEGCIIRKLDAGSRTMVCPCHFSAFEIDGVLRKGPAGSPLATFPYQRVGSVLMISVPDLFYDVTFNRSPSNDRVQIRFVAFYQTRYEVYFRERLDGPAQVVPFALSESAPVFSIEALGNENSEYVTLYLEKPGTAGFFQVAVKTTQV